MNRQTARRPSRARPWLWALSVVGLGALLAAPATSDVKRTIEGPVRTICATTDLTRHPTRADLTTVIADDRFETAEGVSLVAFYSRHPATQGPRGKLSATATLIRADGSQQSLGRLQARQARANEPLLIVKGADVPLVEGDVVQWQFKLRGFADLAGSCFNLGGLVGIDE